MTIRTFVAALAVAGLGAVTAEAQVNLSGETAGQGGVPGTVHAHLAEVAAERGIANLQVQYGQTLTNSVQNLAEGKSDIVSGPQALVFLLNAGRGPYSGLEDGKGAELASNLRALFTYSFGYTYLAAFDSNGIDSWDDLKGKRVYNGPPRGAALVAGRQVIQLMGAGQDGTDYTGVQVNWAQDIDTITGGSADAWVLPGTFPDRRVTAAVASGKVTLVSQDKDIFESESFQKFATAPGQAPLRIKVEDMGYAGMEDQITVVAGDDGIFRATSTAGSELVHKDMDEELAYQLTMAFIETLPALKAKTPWAPQVGLDVTSVPESGLCGVNPLKYHPGAIRAWEEAGYTIPDCAKP